MILFNRILKTSEANLVMFLTILGALALAHQAPTERSAITILVAGILLISLPGIKTLVGLVLALGNKYE